MSNSENMASFSSKISHAITSLIDQGLAWPIYCAVVAANGAMAGLHYVDQDGPRPGLSSRGRVLPEWRVQPSHSDLLD
jgi:hypothetical protein